MELGSNRDPDLCRSDGFSRCLYTLVLSLSSGEGGKASISLLLVPVIGTISGSIFLGERFHYISVIGIFFIIAALVLVNKQDNQPANKHNDPNEISLNKAYIK